MTQDILCAIDLEHVSISKKILKKAEILVGDNGGIVNVVTVIPDYGMTIVGSYFEEGVMEKALASAKDSLRQFVSDNYSGSAKIRHIVARGNAYEEVLDTAKKVGVDLIVIGASKPDFKDYLLGPNASRVARHANVSVYIVRE